ncbi:hypothetical protein SLEP1_g33216 [Rubroshorea leprosula]|uniref:Rho-GAP domain-containing protein n=1 Tax=Rubroshorea leprosula TaxID=152421 RepID=A0AAV5KFZ0_9ROSI|nr:hypothetical protein SLEP1_g33216 [Rubroshorea leprosula]
MASQEVDMVKAQAVAEYSSYLKPYQCAVCFCPTTTRCSLCKSARYCPSMVALVSVKLFTGDKVTRMNAILQLILQHTEIYGEDFGVEGEFKDSPKASLLEEGEDDNGEHSRGVPTEFASSSASAFADTNLSDDFDPDMARSATSPKKT